LVVAAAAGDDHVSSFIQRCVNGSFSRGLPFASYLLGGQHRTILTFRMTGC
jgi:hypothetical protein